MQIILFLARNKKVISSSDLSKSLQISQRYVIQIAGRLRDASLIETRTGVSGGYSLSKEPSTISVYDIVSLLEGEMCIPECVSKCSNDRLQSALSVIKECLDTHLKEVTFDKIADMDTTGRVSDLSSIVETHLDTVGKKEP